MGIALILSHKIHIFTITKLATVQIGIIFILKNKMASLVNIHRVYLCWSMPGNGVDSVLARNK